MVSKSRANIPEILVEDLSIPNKGSHPSVNEGRSHSTALSYRKHLLLEDSEDASSGYESAASSHKPNRAKKRVSSSKRTQLLRAAMFAEHAMVHKDTRTQGTKISYFFFKNPFSLFTLIKIESECKIDSPSKFVAIHHKCFHQKYQSKSITR